METTLYFADYFHRGQCLTLLASSRGLCFLALPHERAQAIAEFVSGHRIQHLKENPPLLAPYLEQLDEYFHGDRHVFTVPLDILSGTPFQRQVWETLRRIPFGHTRSYADVASAAGYPRASRAVGTAVSKNPIAIMIPCHRVIGSNGTLTGFAGGLNLKQHLLELEGVRVNPRGHAKYAF